LSSSQLTLQFLGAAGTVTGSRFLASSGELNVLIDCGLFQGRKELRLRNWQEFPVEPSRIDAVILTHAHLDHSGYLPALVAAGFRGPIFSTVATRDLCEILLRDAGKLQEEEARYHQHHKTSKHSPARPLFTVTQVEKALKQFETCGFNETRGFGEMDFCFYPNGHILGSAFLDLKISGRHLLFSGDLGRSGDLVMKHPHKPAYCDYMILESTYGGRRHEDNDAVEKIASLISETARRGGSVLIPSFAVGRAQLMLHIVHKLTTESRIPPMPLYMDSPMSIDATEIMLKHSKLHRLTREQVTAMCEHVNFTRTVEQSKAISLVNTPKIIISASGMATGGRVLHHLRGMLGDHRNTVIFAGYQATGTRGDRLVNGEKKIKIFGEFHQVDARIESLDFLSAHADHEEIIRWLTQSPVAPKRCFLVHGEPESAEALRDSISDTLGWRCSVATDGEIVKL
jgi:metallo-beta-lactamase family protein